MKWFFELATSGLGPFLACFLLVYAPLHYAFKFYNRGLRQKNIDKHGYPPAHCDADGDFREAEDSDD